MAGGSAPYRSSDDGHHRRHSGLLQPRGGPQVRCSSVESLRSAAALWRASGPLQLCGGPQVRCGSVKAATALQLCGCCHSRLRFAAALWRASGPLQPHGGRHSRRLAETFQTQLIARFAAVIGLGVAGGGVGVLNGLSGQ